MDQKKQEEEFGMGRVLQKNVYFFKRSEIRSN